MSLPETVRAEVGDETVVDRVDLGGDDRLYVTPTRTLRYRADGLLSDESVAAVPHGAERIDAEVGRRTATLTFGYGLDGDRSISLPAGRFDDALEPILAGVLRAAGVTDPDESVVAAFRFSDLTLVVADDRLVKHVGGAVWDADHESYRFADVSDLAFEEGSVATAVVLTVAGRRERFKIPSGSSRVVRERLRGALLSHHGVDRIADLPGADRPSEAAGDRSESGRRAAGADALAAGLELPSAGNGEAAVEAVTGGGDGGADGDGDADLAAEVAALREVVERQNDRLRRQEALVERLIDELRSGR